MEFEIVKEKDMPLLARKRMTLSATFHGTATPSNAQFVEGLAKKLKVDAKLIAIRHIYQRFGEGYAKVIAHVYNTEKDLKELEHTKKKKFTKKEEKKEEAPKEGEGPKEEKKEGEAPKEEAKEKKEEAPKEEVKEEEVGKETDKK